MKSPFAMLSLLLLSLSLNAWGQKLDPCSRTGENPVWSLVLGNGGAITPAKIEAGVTALPEDKLTNAVVFGYIRLLNKLLTDKKLVEKHGGDALSAAAAMGRLAISRILLDSGIPANAINQMGTTALYGAVQYGCSEEVRLLIKYGANVNYRGSYSVTPMIDAVTERHFKTAAVLLQNGYQTTPAELTTIKSILFKQGSLSVWEFLFAQHHSEAK